MKYTIWTNGMDETGFTANTIIEAIDLIWDEFWWTGEEHIVDTTTNKVVAIVNHDNCTKGYNDMVKRVRG